ncbi:hypothetical protein EAS62_13305 [Bradyrhizobium zhanjiangense]|uniref:Uncharacterized protein n=1 Tax=Bradyrhizobium zhanjiangense TaxID=1325107 RepID=A0ABY0DNX6_9BRAD|nr:hypothetical protein EAS62_13305 [Bradyrhizobium zhanjiangense]
MTLHPPLEGEGRSRAARAGWGDLSTRAGFDAERPSPHPATHCAALHAWRPSPPGEGKCSVPLALTPASRSPHHPLAVSRP